MKIYFSIYDKTRCHPGNLVVQTEAGDLEWDLEPGLDHGASSPVQSDQHSGNIDLFIIWNQFLWFIFYRFHYK